MEEVASTPTNSTAALDIETIDNSTYVLKNEKLSRNWIIFHMICLILSIILLIICFTIPVTGSFLVYDIILLCISIDAIITTRCKNGICCVSQNTTINKIDDILKTSTTFIWILAFTICFICGISDTLSAYTFYNRWEEVLPIFMTIIIQIILIQKILICRNKLQLSSENITNINYITSNFKKYHNAITLNSNCISYKVYFFPLKWLFLLFIMFLAFLMFIHAIEKSHFINTFNERNTNILETKNYGSFEYQCMGYNNDNVLPIQDSSIRIIAIGGMSTIHLSFGFYNHLIWNEYGIKYKKKLVICDYNRGGFGFTETKEYNNKLIKPETNHLFEIADQLFGINTTFHLMGHSRAGLVLLQAKMLNVERVESIVVFDGVSNANIIKNGLYDRKIDNWDYYYVLYSLGTSVMPFSMLKPFIIGMAGGDMYEDELSAKYYGFRNYMYQSIAWETRDMKEAWINTVKMYDDMVENNNFTFDPVLNIECFEDYNEKIRYSVINNTVYVKTAHAPCVYDRNIANMTFYYNDNGLKQFYDALFL